MEKEMARILADAERHIKNLENIEKKIKKFKKISKFLNVVMIVCFGIAGVCFGILLIN